MNDAEAVVLAHFDDEAGEVLVGDAAAQLAVQGIDRGLAQGMAVDVVDCAAEGVGVEDSTPDFLSVVLQPVIGAEAGAGGAAQLSAY